MKAVSYARVSTEEQAREGFSLGAQDEKNFQFIKTMDWNFIGYYVDPGKSGKDLKRPEMQRLLGDLGESKFNVVVVTKLDRLTRNIGDLYDLINLFDKKSIKLVSITENIDTSTAMGRMFVFMLGIFAQWYRENLAEDVTRGMSARASKGMRNSLVPIFGYTYVDGELVINKEQSEWVQWIFTKYISGWGITRITRELNIMKLPTMRGGVWHWDTVQGMIKNHTYIGYNHWKPKNAPESERIIAEGKHTPIIEKDIFDAAQERMKRISVGQINRGMFEFIFSTILKCTCGRPFHGRANRRTLKTTGQAKAYHNYRCSGKDRLGNCSVPDITEWKVEELFLKELRLNISGQASDKPMEIKKDHSKERKRLEKEMLKSEQMRDKWAYAYGEGKIELEQFSRLMDAEQQKVQTLEQQLSELPDFQREGFTQQDITEHYNDIMSSWPRISTTAKKQMIQVLFKQIVLEHDGEWKIKRIDMQE